jgi:hypothetical protein
MSSSRHSGVITARHGLGLHVLLGVAVFAAGLGGYFQRSPR